MVAGPRQRSAGDLYLQLRERRARIKARLSRQEPAKVGSDRQRFGRPALERQGPHQQHLRALAHRLFARRCSGLGGHGAAGTRESSLKGVVAQLKEDLVQTHGLGFQRPDLGKLLECDPAPQRQRVCGDASSLDRVGREMLRDNTARPAHDVDVQLALVQVEYIGCTDPPQP